MLTGERERPKEKEEERWSATQGELRRYKRRDSLVQYPAGVESDGWGLLYYREERRFSIEGRRLTETGSTIVICAFGFSKRGKRASYMKERGRYRGACNGHAVPRNVMSYGRSTREDRGRKPR